MTYHIATPKFFSAEMFIIFAVVLLIIFISSFIICRGFRRTLDARAKQPRRQSSFMHRLGSETSSNTYLNSEENNYRRGGSDAGTPLFHHNFR